MITHTLTASRNVIDLRSMLHVMPEDYEAAINAAWDSALAIGLVLGVPFGLMAGVIIGLSFVTTRAPVRRRAAYDNGWRGRT
jgi:hypothetical protein